MVRVIPASGLAWVLFLLVAVPGSGSRAFAATTLSGETSRPEMSLFVQGDDARLRFAGAGAPPGQLRKLTLKAIDELDRPLFDAVLDVPVDAAGNGSAEYAAPTRRFGFYRVFAALDDGTRLPRTGSRAEGFLTYGVVVDPATRPLYPSAETFFGMQGGFNPAVNILPYLGVRRGLGGWGWKQTETEPGNLPALRAAAKAKGKSHPERPLTWGYVEKDGRREPWKVYTIPSLYNPDPKWDDRFMVPGTRGSNKGPGALTPEGEKAWRQYCLDIGKAMAEDYTDTDPQVVEITWEPNYPWGYHGTDEQLIRIFEIAHQALHEVNPKIQVGAYTSSNIDNVGFRRLLEKGLGRYMDCVTVHPYKNHPPESIRPQQARMKADMRELIGRELPIYGTEQGNATHEKTELELQQAQIIVRASLMLLGEGWKANVSFYSTDYPGEPGYGLCYALCPDKHFGCPKVGPKPSAMAYAAMTRFLEGHRSVGVIDYLGDSVLGYVYERPGSLVMALWDWGGNNSEVTLPVGVPQVEVYDWMGNARTLDCPGGMATLRLSGEPQYVRGLSPGLWSADAPKPLAMIGSVQPRAFPGGAPVFKATVRAVGGDLAGKLVFRPDPRLGPPQRIDVGLASGAAREFSVPLSLRPAQPEGAYPFQWVLEKDGLPLAAVGGVLTVAAPVRIASLLPAYANNAFALAVELEEMTGAEQTGRLDVRVRGVPGGRVTRTVTLAPGGRQTLEVPLGAVRPDPAQRWQAVAEWRKADTGFGAEKTAMVNFWSAPKRDAVPEDLPAEAAVLRGPEALVRTPAEWSGPEDQEVRTWLGWNDRALLLWAEVDDDVYLQPFTGFLTWTGDCIQMGIDLDHGQEIVSTGNQQLDRAAARRESELDFALTAAGPEAYRTATFNADTHPVRQLTSAEANVNVRRLNDKTLRYRVEIPWITLGHAQPPKAGDRIGVAIHFNDRDRPAGDQLDPSALGAFPLKKAEQFGTVLLAPAE